jgi:platelet-activating factor acetylhydrolase
VCPSLYTQGHKEGCNPAISGPLFTSPHRAPLRHAFNYYITHLSISNTKSRNMSSEDHYTDDVELGSFRDDDPDSPLPLSHTMHASTPKPRWLPDARPRWLTERKPRWFPSDTPRWLSSPSAPDRWKIFQRLPLTLQPRLTWRYLLFSFFLLYILYCLIRGSPLLASKLPRYTGPHEVGAIDLEVPLERPRRTSESVFRSTGKPAFELETVLFTLYHPVAKGARSSKPNHRWIPPPISLTAEGYARFAHVNNFLIRPIFHFALWAIAGSIQIPAKVDVPLLGAETIEKFPVMVFSHGMASSRTDYTHYCGELASRGHVIAAIEHRDGSGPGTLIMGTDGSVRKLVHFDVNDLLYVCLFPSLNSTHRISLSKDPYTMIARMKTAD